MITDFASALSGGLVAAFIITLALVRLWVFAKALVS